MTFDRAPDQQVLPLSQTVWSGGLGSGGLGGAPLPGGNAVRATAGATATALALEHEDAVEEQASYLGDARLRATAGR